MDLARWSPVLSCAAMADRNGLPDSLSPSTSDTDSVNAFSSAASPAISPLEQTLPSPPNAYAEKTDTIYAQINGTDVYPPREGGCSVSSNLDEEMVRQHEGDTDGADEHQARDASPIHQGDNVGQPSDTNSRGNAGQMAMEMFADAEKGPAFPNVKQADAAEEVRGECCRVCHLSGGKRTRAGEFVKLGCACKDDLALAHRHCAETWFKIKGNRTCEICGSTAQNILGNGGVGHGDHPRNDVEANNIGPRRAERFWQDQPIFNTVLVCVILVLLAAWLFRVTLF